MTKIKMAANGSDVKPRPKVTHYGSFDLIPGVHLECAILADGRRGFVQRQMLESIGFSGGDRNARFERFSTKIGLNYLKENSKTECPVFEVEMPNGGVARWSPMEVLVDVVKAGAIALYQGKLTKQQHHIGMRCVELSNALIGVGLASLIDEASGFQMTREQGALLELMHRLVRKEARDWERRFQPEYYRALCGLFGFKYGNNHRPLPHIIGRITEQWVYMAAMPQEILDEIRARKGSEKLHQWLTEEDGLRILEKQIEAVTMIAKSSVDYKDFDARCSQVFYRKGAQMGMVLPVEGRAA